MPLRVLCKQMALQQLRKKHPRTTVMRGRQLRRSLRIYRHSCPAANASVQALCFPTMLTLPLCAAFWRGSRCRTFREQLRHMKRARKQAHREMFPP